MAPRADVWRRGNLAGYLIGVLGGRPLPRRLGTARALDGGMGLVALAFAACAWNGGFSWLVLWRALAGVAGGLLMALAGPAIQVAVPPAQRGAAGGIVVAGVGGGVIVASLLVPVLLPAGVPATWLGLAALVLLPVGLRPPPLAANPGLGRRSRGRRRRAQARCWWPTDSLGPAWCRLWSTWPISRCAGRGLGAGIGALLWLLFGTGALLGTLAGGRAADR